MAKLEQSNEPRTESSSRVTAFAALFTSVAVPLVIAGIGAWYNVNVKDSENRVRYVELAIAQLRTPPTPETSALREWAVEMLDSQAPVKLSPAAKLQLKSNPLSVQLSGAAVAHSEARGDLSTRRLGSASGSGSPTGK